MAKKGQTYCCYTPKLKAEAVRIYEESGLSYEAVAKMLGVKSNSQIKAWVAKSRSGKSFEDKRGKSTTWRKGRPKTKFSSVEEELAYVKAERDYLKKRCPNLHGEVCQRRKDSK